MLKRIKEVVNSFVQEAKSLDINKEKTKNMEKNIDPWDNLDSDKIGDKLKEEGILPWLDVWDLQPGKDWINFREPSPDPFRELVWGITGDKDWYYWE